MKIILIIKIIGVIIVFVLIALFYTSLVNDFETRINNCLKNNTDNECAVYKCQAITGKTYAENNMHLLRYQNCLLEKQMRIR
jgi:hypothetical protein